MSRTRQNPLLVFLIHMTQSIMLRQIAYLKAENAILRSRCAKNIQTTPGERSLLVRLGKPLGNAIQELLSLVHYKTFQRWVRDEAKPTSEKAKRPPGRSLPATFRYFNRPHPRPPSRCRSPWNPRTSRPLHAQAAAVAGAAAKPGG